jgi:Leucine-rich repeat (LRR) protein
MEEEQITGKKYAEEEHVELIFKGIEGVDSATINSFKNCSKLSLSSNLIAKVPEIQLDRLKILSIGRNRIKYTLYYI